MSSHTHESFTYRSSTRAFILIDKILDVVIHWTVVSYAMLCALQMAGWMLLIEKYLINVISSKNNATCKWKMYYCIELAVVNFYPHVCTRNIQCFDWLRWLAQRHIYREKVYLLKSNFHIASGKNTHTHFDCTSQRPRHCVKYHHRLWWSFVQCSVQCSVEC